MCSNNSLQYGSVLYLLLQLKTYTSIKAVWCTMILVMSYCVCIQPRVKIYKDILEHGQLSTFCIFRYCNIKEILGVSTNPWCHMKIHVHQHQALLQCITVVIESMNHAYMNTNLWPVLWSRGMHVWQYRSAGQCMVQKRECGVDAPCKSCKKHHAS